MNCRVKYLTRKLGFCCPFSYFHATRSEKVVVIAAELGVSERTVKLWRSKLKDGKVPCSATPGCFIQVHKDA